MFFSLSPFASENLVSRDGFGSPVPRQPAHLHSQAESGAYLRDYSRFPRRRPFIYLQPPYAIGSVPSLLGHATAYRWRSLPRVPRHRPSKPQGGSKRVLSWQVNMRFVWVIPFILDVRLVDAPAGVTQEEGHKGVVPSAVLALIFLAMWIQLSLPFPRRS